MAVGTVAGPRITVVLPWKVKRKVKGAETAKQYYALSYMKEAVAKILQFEQARKESDDITYSVGTGDKKTVHYRKGSTSGKNYKLIFEEGKGPTLPSGKKGKATKQFESISFNVHPQVRTNELVEHIEKKVKGAKFLITPAGKRIDIIKTA
jgi:hypothetical protein